MKLFLRILTLIFILFVAAVVALPFVANTSFAKQWIEKSADGRLKIDSISLSWTGEQSIKGLNYANASNTRQLEFSELVSSDSLMRFLINGFSFNHLKVISPKLSLSYAKTSQAGSGYVIPLIYLKQLVIEKGVVTFRQGNGSPLQFNDIDLTVEFPGRAKPLQINLFSKIREGGRTGVLQISSDCVFDPRRWRDTLACRIEANIQNFPLAGLDRLIRSWNPSYPNLLSQSIGDVLNLKSKVSLSKKYCSVLAQVESKYIQADIDTSRKEKVGSLTYNLTPTTFQFLIGGKTQLQKNVVLGLNLDQFEVPSDREALQFNRLGFDLALNVSPIDLIMGNQHLQISNLSSSVQSTNVGEKIQGKLTGGVLAGNLFLPLTIQGEFQDLFYPHTIRGNLIGRSGKYGDELFIDEINIDFSGDHFREIAFKGIVDVNPNQENPNLALLGKELKSNIKGVLAFLGSGSISVSDFSFDTVSNYLQAKFKAKANGNFSKIEVTEPFNVSYNVNPKRLLHLRERFGTEFVLVKKSPIYLTIDPFSYDSNRKGRELSFMKGKVFVENLELRDVAHQENVVLDQAHALLTYDPKERDFDLKLESSFADHEKLKGELVCDLAMHRVDLEHIEDSGVDLSIQATRLPLILLSPVIDLPVGASDLIGKVLDISAHFVLTKSTKECRIRLGSPYLQIDGSLDFKDNLKLKGRSPLKVDWTLTPLGYQILSQHGQDAPARPVFFAFEEPAQFNLQLEKLNWPLDHSGPTLLPRLSSDYMSGAFKGALRVNSLVVKDINSNMTARSKSSKFLLDKRANDALHFDLDSRIDTQSGSGSKSVYGSIDGSGMLFIPFKDGKVKYKGIELSTTLKINHLPTLLLDALFQGMRLGSVPPSVVLGDSINAIGKTHIKNQNGSLSLALDSETAKMDLDGAVIGGKLMLKRPFTTSLTLTKKLDALLFQKFDIYAVRSRRPINLVVDSKGVVIPLSQFSISQVQIPSMQLNLGKMRFYNRGNVQLMGDIFKLDRVDALDLWFAPFDLHLQRGVLDVERTEILYDDRYHLCLWGDIDLTRRYIDLIIGVTAEALKRSTGISGLPSNYVMKVPFKGPFGQARIDKAAVLAKIALMVAQRSAGDQMGPLGGILDVVQGAIDNQADVPPPKRPYPWSNQLSSKEEVSKIPLQHALKKRGKEKAIFDRSFPFETFLPDRAE